MNKNLAEGDKVAIISPSATIKDNPEAKVLCKNGEKILTDLGLQVVYGKHTSGKLYYKSGTIADRVADIEWAFENPDIKTIFCAQGGDNSNELLPFLDWGIIENNPKFFFWTKRYNSIAKRNVCPHKPNFLSWIRLNVGAW